MPAWGIGGPLGLNNENGNVVLDVCVLTCGNVFGSMPELWELLVLNGFVVWYVLVWKLNAETATFFWGRRASVD